MDQVLDSSIARQRMSLIIFVTFAGVALILAAVGLYGVVAHGVTERTHEIGVRMALGAGALAGAYACAAPGFVDDAGGDRCGTRRGGRLIAIDPESPFRSNSTDPRTFVAVPIALLGVAAVACAVPAWRAARVDPTMALRTD